MEASEEIVKEYSNNGLTVIWKPKKCIHSGICVQKLPKVYNPDERPWIKPENASNEALMEQIQACPSGALTYKTDDSVKPKETKPKETKSNDMTSVNIIENGPLIVQSTCEVNYPDGSSETKKRSAAFCRCGASSAKPYCDGSHTEINFQG